MDAQKKIFRIALIFLLLTMAAFLIYGWRGSGGKEPWQRTHAYQALSPEERRSCDQIFQAMFEYYEKAHAVSPSQAKRAFPDQEYENWVPHLCTPTGAPLPGSLPPPASDVGGPAPPLLAPLPAPELPDLPVPPR